MFSEQAKMPTASRLGGLDARPSIRHSLEMHKKELEVRLQEINDALDIMTTKPEIAEAFEKLRRVI